MEQWLVLDDLERVVAVLGGDWILTRLFLILILACDVGDSDRNEVGQRIIQLMHLNSIPSFKSDRLSIIAVIPSLPYRMLEWRTSLH